MSPSHAVWAANLYPEAAVPPSPTAPLRDLAARPAGRFRTLRDGLLAIPDVREEVRFMGPTWRWAWEYGLGSRKLCWVHVLRGGPSATFALAGDDEVRLLGGTRPPAALRRAAEEGQRTGPVKWCWVPLDDARTVAAFVAFARRKAESLRQGPDARRPPAPRSRAGPARGPGGNPGDEPG